MYTDYAIAWQANGVLGAALGQASVQQPVTVPRHHTSSSRPATSREAAMDLIDLANIKVFGNKHFRPKQREIIKATLQVIVALVFLLPIKYVLHSQQDKH